MKVRDSGMPEQSYWESLFDVRLILNKMDITRDIKSLVEFGCGYGTFTLPSAKVVSGKIIAFDIDDQMLEIINARAISSNLNNVSILKRDFISEGTGIENDSADYVMLFNILHHVEPSEILTEAYRILKKGGRVGLIHWNYDSKTPRGPSMDIRPKPEDMRNWILNVGFRLESDLIDLPPYHYGFVAYKR
ncbi:MAG: methyltransferase type 11 [Firmicutes bacterium]|nr:methyltransferase type 11 [Bacillota bacterium]